MRERSIVVYTILIPIILYPLLLWLMYTGFTFVSGQAADMDSRVMLVNFPAKNPELRRDFTIDKRIKIIDSKDPQSDLRIGTLDALVVFTPEGEKDFRTDITYDGSRDQSTQARRVWNRK